MVVIPHKENCIAVVHTSNDDKDIYYFQPHYKTLDMELLTQQQRSVAVADPTPPPPIYICTITCPRTVIQKFKDQDIQNYSFAFCFVWV
jgi:hypothetical protein